MKAKELSTRELVGGGYDAFWKSKKRYVVCKGSRASKKSTTAALKIIVRMMQYPLANTLVVRKTGASLKDSCFAQLRWAIERLGVSAWWKARVSPLELEYVPTGQRILFRGMDDPLKVTSITVKHGVLCWGWLEEAFEVEEDAFNRIDESLRGQLPEGYYVQWLISFNPWSSSSWLKARFFDTPHDNVLAMTTTYKCNEWLSDADRAMFEEMKRTDPERYKVAGCGEWGIEAGQFFKAWRESKHVIEPFTIPNEWMRFRSMDWGYNDPCCVLWHAVDGDGRIYTYRELYVRQQRADQVAQSIIKLSGDEEISYTVASPDMWQKRGAILKGDGFEGESLAELFARGGVPLASADNARIAGWQRVRGYMADGADGRPMWQAFDCCENLIRTLPMLMYSPHNREDAADGEDHAPEALRYGLMSRPNKSSIKELPKRRAYDPFSSARPQKSFMNQ